MKIIPLRNSALVAFVDDEYFDLVNRNPWDLLKGYAYYRYWDKGAKEYVSVYMHRIILSGVPRVDHRDRNKLNNQRFNLRPATPIQNQGNRWSHGKTSKFKGVSAVFNKGVFRGWRANIRDGKMRNLGTFKTQEEAAKVYNCAAIVKYREFALLNSL